MISSRRLLAGIVLAGVVLAGLLAACTLDDDPIAREGDPAAEEPTAAPRTPHERTERACTQATEQRVSARVGDQLDAFARGDTEAAWELASQAFRRSVSAEELATIIEERFPAVAAAEEHVVGHCRRTGDRVSVIVAVSGRDGSEQMLDYELTREWGGWYVDGAVPLDAPEDDPDVVTVPIARRAGP